VLEHLVRDGVVEARVRERQPVAVVDDVGHVVDTEPSRPSDRVVDPSRLDLDADHRCRVGGEEHGVRTVARAEVEQPPGSGGDVRPGQRVPEAGELEPVLRRYAELDPARHRRSVAGRQSTARSLGERC